MIFFTKGNLHFKKIEPCVRVCVFVVCLTISQIMNVIPQTEEVRVTQGVFRGDPAPDVVLQENRELVRSAAADGGSAGVCLIPAAAPTAGRSPQCPT